MKLKYFSNRDFELCSPSCSIDDMDNDFLRKLDEAREKAGVPFKLNSAYRTYTHELAQGRSGNSAHTKGKAVDISCADSFQRFKILNALIEVGFTRIGIAKTFIHVDSDDKRLSPNVIWTY